MIKHKIFRIALIACLLTTSIFIGGTAYAQDEELPDPGITPDSPFYFMDTLGKNIGMFFAFGPEAKARKALQYAGERLAETRAMANKNRVREMELAANDYEGFMTMVNQRAEEAIRQGATENISETVALATSKHLSVLDRVKEKLPEQAKAALTRARNASMNGQVNALRALSKVRAERAIDINLDEIEGQLERARVKASENMTADVEEALNYATRLDDLEEEMLTLAEEKGIDITALRQRLAQAVTNRLQVLAGVYEKVPENARQGIENAIGNSVSKYQRAIEKLKEENALGEIPEETPALERVRAEVRERLQINIKENTTEQARIQAEVREQENVRENTQNLKPETTTPAISANKTRGTSELNNSTDNTQRDDNRRNTSGKSP